MIKLENRQIKLLEVIRKKQKSGLSIVIFDEDLDFYNSIEDYFQDIRILKFYNIVSVQQTYGDGNYYRFLINGVVVKEFDNYLNSMEHKMYIVLCKIDELLKNNNQLQSLAIKLENIDDMTVSCIIKEITQRGFIEASNPIKTTTSRCESYIIFSVTFRGKQVIQNEEILFNSYSPEINIDNSVNNSNNISYQGDNGNIVQANNSKNENIKQEQFKETKKENWLIRFFKWVRDFWFQLFIGIITGVISTLIVEWILGVFSK